MRHLHALTGLRFVAAAHVLALHVLVPALVMDPGWGLNILVSPGGAAVSLFFVLSGFVLTYSYAPKLRDRWDLAASKRFWVSRFARLYPAYLLGLVLAIPTAIIVLGGASLLAAFKSGIGPGFAALREGGLARSPAYIAELFVRTLTLTQSWKPSSTSMALTWNSPAWSLSVEAFFYLLFPLAGLAIVRLPRRSMATLLVALWIAGMAITGWLLAHPSALGPIERSPMNAVMLHPLIRLPEFLMGMVAARIFLDRDGEHHSARFHSLVLVGCVAIAFSLMAIAPSLPWYIVHNGGLALCFAAIVYVCAAQRTRLIVPLTTRPMIKLGEASYSLYIIHFPLVLGVTGLTETLGYPTRSNLWFDLAFLPVAVFAALLSYLYVELPGRAFILRRLQSQRPPAREDPQREPPPLDAPPTGPS